MLWKKMRWQEKGTLLIKKKKQITKKENVEVVWSIEQDSLLPINDITSTNEVIIGINFFYIMLENFTFIEGFGPMNKIARFELLTPCD